MRQEIAQRISNSILAWRDAEERMLLMLPLKTTGAEFEEALQDQISKRVEGTHLGCRIAIVVMRRTNPIDKLVTAIWKAVNDGAFDHYKNIDFLEVVRVKADERGDEGICMELVEIEPKREVWL